MSVEDPGVTTRRGGQRAGHVAEEDTSSQWSELMQRAQAGDGQAYNGLLKELLPVLRVLVRKHRFDDAVIDDVIQDVLLAIHRVRHTYDPARPFLPWLLAIVNARCIDEIRRRGRRHSREVRDDEAHLTHPDPAAQQHAESMEARDELDSMIAALSPRQRRLVEMVYLREMSLAEAADASRLSVSAVKALLHRALTSLRGRRGHHD